MSHTIGRFIANGTRIGPDSGDAPTVPGEWHFAFNPAPALMGGDPRFVVLRLTAMDLPGASRVEVDVGYGLDVFTSADGSEGWTRPIDGKTAPITIKYIGPGPAGGVTFAEYGSGEPTETDSVNNAFDSITNPDVFLHTDPYDEPDYQTWLKCGGVFDWQDAACDGDPVHTTTAAAVGMLVSAHREGSKLVLSSCSATLIDADLVISARHCFDETDGLDVASCSITFDYATDCGGGKPLGYAPQFHKVRRVVAAGAPPKAHTDDTDWIILQIETPPGGLGITPRELRPSLPIAGEPVFAVHHPNGAVKKIQSGTLQTSIKNFLNFDFGGGSSGSALFDASGRIIGAALSRAASAAQFTCSVSYTGARQALDAIANPPPPPSPLDVMLVIDRSGSMAGAGTSPGLTKLDEAKEAASLFVQLVRAGAGHRIGMVSFSTTASNPVDTNLGNVNPGKKNQLVGPAPYVTGDVGALAAGGLTSIGGGLAKAATEFGGGNQRSMLLLTDGLQNTAPLIHQVEASLADTKLCIVGFGPEYALDGPLLTDLARDHDGIYTRANDGLVLKKFFALCFGDIFEAGTLADPMERLERGQEQGKRMPFDVCDEEAVTVVLGWDDPEGALEATLITPSGATIAPGQAGTETDAGRTWWFTRIALPFDGEREGRWHVEVRRPPTSGEFPPPPVALTYFVTVVPSGGPTLVPFANLTRLYTGDPYTPTVALHYADGTTPHAHVELEIDAPAGSLGELTTRAGLAQPVIDGDQLDAFHATLAAIAEEAGGDLPIGRRQLTVELFDDAQHDDGAMEPDGIYANPLPDLTRYEGTYVFRARATYGHDCAGQREAHWAIAVVPGVDPGRTDVVGVPGPGGGDPATGVIRITPRDVFGSPLGPGRGDGLSVSGTGGTTVTGPAVDNGDGSYDVPAEWPAGTAPGVVVGQPGRDPVCLEARDGAPPPPRPTPPKWCPPWAWALLAAVALAWWKLAHRVKRRRRKHRHRGW